MLDPMQLQLLVGLMSLRRSPDAVKVIVGDLVEDSIAQKKRDVDVTVTTLDGKGISTLAALEVKKEKRRLDIATAEQLAAKLGDMPSLKTRGIVSASGFTDGAISKCLARGITPFGFEQFHGALSELFPKLSLGSPVSDAVGVAHVVYQWDRIDKFQLNPHLDPELATLLAISRDDRLFDNEGAGHTRFPTIGSFIDHMANWSASKICRDNAVYFPSEKWLDGVKSTPAGSVVATTSSQVDFTIEIEDPVFFKVNETLKSIDQIAIVGTIRVSAMRSPMQFHVIRDATSGDVFGGAAIAPAGPGRDDLVGLLFNPEDSLLQTAHIALTDDQRNMLRKLRIR